MEILRVDNQPACLVLPSDDQPQNQRGFSLLVVEYPDLYEGRTRLLLLFADKNHIHDFIGSLKFIR
jgi:TolB protein